MLTKRKKLCIGMRPEKLLVRCAWGQVMMAKGLQTVFWSTRNMLYLDLGMMTCVSKFPTAIPQM